MAASATLRALHFDLFIYETGVVVTAYTLDYLNFTYLENFSSVATIYSYSHALPNGATVKVSLHLSSSHNRAVTIP